MFDIAWSEILVIFVVGLLILGPDEIPTVIRFIRGLIQKVKSLSQQCMDVVKEVEDAAELKDVAKKVNEDIKTIVDLEGKEQETFDISEMLDEHDKNKQPVEKES